MCDPKPGARCSADTWKELTAARAKAAAAARDVDRFPDDAAAHRRLAFATYNVQRKLEAWDSSPRGQRELENEINASSNPDSPENDALRTRLYVGRHTRIEQKKALARAQGKSAAEARLDVDKALNRLRHPDGGFTRHPETGREETLGFFVSCYPDRETIVALQELRPRHIREHREANEDLYRRTGHYMGGWHDPDTGLVFLDVSVKTETAQAARSDAETFNQVSFYDAQMGSSVSVNPQRAEQLAHEHQRNNNA